MLSSRATLSPSFNFSAFCLTAEASKSSRLGVGAGSSPTFMLTSWVIITSPGGRSACKGFGSFLQILYLIKYRVKPRFPNMLFHSSSDCLPYVRPSLPTALLGCPSLAQVHVPSTGELSTLSFSRMYIELPPAWLCSPLGRLWSLASCYHWVCSRSQHARVHSPKPSGTKIQHTVSP